MINVWLLELLVLNSPWGQGGNDLSDFLGLAHLSLVYIMLTDSLSLPLHPSVSLFFFLVFCLFVFWISASEFNWKQVLPKHLTRA